MFHNRFFIIRVTLEFNSDSFLDVAFSIDKEKKAMEYIHAVLQK